MHRSFTLIVPRSITSILLSLVLFAMSVHANGQKSISNPSEDRDRGIQLYKQGDIKGAIAALRTATKHNNDDISAWHYLGLANEQKGDTGSAKKAYEKAAKLGDIALTKQLDQTFSGKDVGRALMSIRSSLLEAAESAEKYVALNSRLSRSKREEWNVRISSLRGFADLASGEDLLIYSSKDVTTKVRVLSKPEPTYTEEARRHQTTGTIVLRCIFGANGKVFAIRPVTSLPHGLTESAMSAARQIRFIPAVKDGHPVSTWMQLEYNFNLY